MNLPGNVQRPSDREVKAKNAMRDFGGPVYFDQRLWNVPATHSKSGNYYYVNGSSVFYSVKYEGPFGYIGEKGSEVVRRHETNNGLKF